ncbi:MAG: heavy metal translocating P-type ATPase metal-binding domain-containing protein, partial [Burkholderiales bacterium]|nr:heavy metal translocating P-type ATPase metal-binding domain-containing protein [Burkholderiales bacterium]
MSEKSNTLTDGINAVSRLEHCYHCGLENPKEVSWRADIGGTSRAFCCAGCLTIAQTIHAAGLSAFYSTRTAPSKQASPFTDETHDEWSVYDEETVARDFVTTRADGSLEISLLIDGMTCGACVWLIESWLLKQKGVVEARVNYAAHRATLLWRPDETRLSTLLRALSGIGYSAYPYDPNLRDAKARREKRTLLFRMSVALLCMMQVMMMAVPDYLNSEVALFEQAILRWAGFVLTLPALFYSAQPFFKGAFRDISMRRAGMDVPVALGISVAFLVSVVNTLKGGAVYYDSVSMFIALLLVSRYIELISRLRSGETVEALARQ